MRSLPETRLTRCLAGQSVQAIIVFLASFFVYAATVSRTVYAEGSGELVSAIHLLGIAHPTGYPLLCIAGRMIEALIPLGSVAFRVNVVSALFGAASAAVLCLVLQRLFISRWAAPGAALLFAFSRTFWSQAVIAEVYTLNVLFVVLLLLALVRWSESRDRRFLFLLAFVFGLACTNHMTIVLMVPAALAYILLTLGRNRWTILRDIPWMLLFLALGLTLYIYLPIRASVSPAFQWVPLRNLDDVIAHLTGRQYRFHLFALPMSSAAGGILVFARLLAEQFTPYLLLLPAAGIVLVARSNLRLSVFLGVYLLSNIAYCVNYHIDYHGIDVFYLPSFLILAVLAGFAIDRLCRRASPARGGGIQSWSRLLWLGIVALFPAAIALLSNLHINDHRRDRVADQYGRDILSELDPRAVVFAEGDDATFVLSYLRIVEGVRPDVAISDRTGPGHVHVGISPPEGAVGPGRAEFERGFISGGTRPVYYVTRNAPAVPGWRLIPAPLCYRMVSSADSMRRTGVDFWRRCDLGSLDGAVDGKDYWTRKLAANYHYSYAEFLIAGGDTASALDEFRRSGVIAFDSKVIHFNLATHYALAGRLKEAIDELKVVESIDPYFSQAGARMEQLRALQRRRMSGN